MHPTARPTKRSRVAETLGTSSQSDGVSACGYCVNNGIPCVKAEVVTFISAPGVVGKRLKLWILPLPAQHRCGDVDPGDVGFWMLEGSKNHRSSLFKERLGA